MTELDEIAQSIFDKHHPSFCGQNPYAFVRVLLRRLMPADESPQIIDGVQESLLQLIKGCKKCHLESVPVSELAADAT